jgi:S-adenosylmethionine hydrolase
LAVIDPGVGTDRDLVAIESRGQRFVGPDNGLFGWLAGDASVVVIDPDRLPVRGASHTFHGRDLLAPAAGALARGAALGSLGTPKNALRPLPTPPPAAIKPTPGGVRITGRIVEIDHYGNAVTNIPRELLGSVRLEAMRVECAGQTVVGLTRTYGDAPPGSLVALVGSDDDVELAVVNDNAAELHGLTVGDEVVIALDNAQRT